MPKRKLISVVVPCYNEEDCAGALAAELRRVFDGLPNYDFEAILVDNGSEDRTWELLVAEQKRDRRFKVVRLMRNFATDGGIAAGLAKATGDAAFIVYADLQDPPAMLGAFLEKWEQGYLNVYGVIKARHDSAIRSFNAGIFYRTMDFLTNGKFPRNVGDFRLVDRSVYETVNKIPEHNRVLRGLFAWVGGRSIGIPYERQARAGGVSKALTVYCIRFALRCIFGFSYLPITILTGLGFVLSAIAFATLFILGLRSFFWGIPMNGTDFIVGLMLLLFGFTFMMLGVIGRYISMMHEDTKGRPNFIVLDEVGFGRGRKGARG
jgi:dolichol-phosphate mannosyltransferase